MAMFLSLQYSTKVSFISSTTFLVTESCPRRDSAKCQLLHLYSPFSSTQILKALKVFIFAAFRRDVPRKTLPRLLQDIVFEHIFLNAFLYRCFFNIDYNQKYRYACKHLEGNSFYICIKFLRDVQRTCEKYPQVTSRL